MNRFAWLLSVIVALAALWSGAWFFAASRIHEEVALMETGTPAMSCGNLDVSGFPFWFEIECSEANFAAEDIEVALPSWHLATLAYWPQKFHFTAIGPAEVNDAFSGSQSEIAWKTLEASLRLSGWRLARLSIVADRLAASDTLLEKLPLASAEHVELHLVEADASDIATDRTNLSTFARISSLVMLKPEFLPANAELDAVISAVPDDIRTWSDIAAPRLWQKGGGQIITNFLTIESVADPLINARVNGHLSLGENGQLQGTLTLVSHGLADQVTALAPPPLGSLILGSEQQDGGYSQVLTIDKGLMRAGIIPLLIFQPLF